MKAPSQEELSGLQELIEVAKLLAEAESGQWRDIREEYSGENAAISEERRPTLPAVGAPEANAQRNLEALGSLGEIQRNDFEFDELMARLNELEEAERRFEQEGSSSEEEAEGRSKQSRSSDGQKPRDTLGEPAETTARAKLGGSRRRAQQGARDVLESRASSEESPQSRSNKQGAETGARAERKARAAQSAPARSAQKSKHEQGARDNTRPRDGPKDCVHMRARAETRPSRESGARARLEGAAQSSSRDEQGARAGEEPRGGLETRVTLREHLDTGARAGTETRVRPGVATRGLSPQTPNTVGRGSRGAFGQSESQPKKVRFAEAQEKRHTESLTEAPSKVGSSIETPLNGTCDSAARDAAQQRKRVPESFADSSSESSGPAGTSGPAKTGRGTAERTSRTTKPVIGKVVERMELDAGANHAPVFTAEVSIRTDLKGEARDGTVIVSRERLEALGGLGKVKGTAEARVSEITAGRGLTEKLGADERVGNSGSGLEGGPETGLSDEETARLGLRALTVAEKEGLVETGLSDKDAVRLGVQNLTLDETEGLGDTGASDEEESDRRFFDELDVDEISSSSDSGFREWDEDDEEEGFGGVISPGETAPRKSKFWQPEGDEAENGPSFEIGRQVSADIQQWLARREKLSIAHSGGTDSAHSAGTPFVSTSYSRDMELEDARMKVRQRDEAVQRLRGQKGVPLQRAETEPKAEGEPKVVRNHDPVGSERKPRSRFKEQMQSQKAESLQNQRYRARRNY